MSDTLFVLLGMVIGAVGTLIGAGGGFILVPLLLYLYPQWKPVQISALSITMVFFNGLSGTVAYAVKRRIDWRGGIFFAVCAIPGSFLGVYLLPKIAPKAFSLFLAIVLLLSSGLMLFKTYSRRFAADEFEKKHSYGVVAHLQNRKLLFLGGLISFCAGAISSILGIGGGILHVPALIFLLGYMVTTATATSHFVLTITSLIAVTGHLLQGHLEGLMTEALLISAGAALGAQIGAWLSHIVNARKIVTVMAIAVGLTALRLLATI